MIRVFDGGPDEVVPDGFTAVRIAIDGTLRSQFDWRNALDVAQTHRARGLKLLWDLDLGLFSRLMLPFSDETQFRSLLLAVQHFVDIVWKDFSQETLGLILYRGCLDFSRSFPWDDQTYIGYENWLNGQPGDDSLRQLFCRDSCVRYLDSLANILPDALCPWVLLDASRILDPLQQALLLNRSCFQRFTLAVRRGLFDSNDIVWEEGGGNGGFLGRKLAVNLSTEAAVGICLPSSDLARPNALLENAIQALLASGTPLRIIPEELLTTEWDGLNHLVVLSDFVGPIGRRKLQGFCAAGGTVVTLGPTLGLAHESLYVNFSPQ